jgi:mono/diheme cytochrome c family protein
MTFKAAAVGLGIALASGAYAARGPAVAAAQGKTQWDGVYTAAQAKRGSAVYFKVCAECHGEELEGKGEAPSLVGGEFGGAWHELTLNDLFERMRKSMPKETPGSLPRPQYADVLAFILQKNEAPAGNTELPADNAALSGIMYKMTK